MVQNQPGTDIATKEILLQPYSKISIERIEYIFFEFLTYCVRLIDFCLVFFHNIFDLGYYFFVWGKMFYNKIEKMV